MLFLEQIADSDSIYHKVLPNLKHLTLHQNPHGHTYMETDSEEGCMTKHGRTVLNNWSESIVHAVSPLPIVKDPKYTVYWSKVGESAGLNVEVLDHTQFKLWMQYFYLSSSCYRKPDEKDCYHGPHKGKW